MWETLWICIFQKYLNQIINTQKLIFNKTKQGSDEVDVNYDFTPHGRVHNSVLSVGIQFISTNLLVSAIDLTVLEARTQFHSINHPSDWYSTHTANLWASHKTWSIRDKDT